MWDATILHQDAYGNVKDVIRKPIGPHMTVGDLFESLSQEYEYFSIFSIRKCQEDECSGY